MSKSKSASTAIRPEWQQIVRQRKTIFGWADWPPVPTLRSGAKVKTPKDDIHTQANDQTEALFQLADEHGVSLEGVRLRLSGWAFRRNNDMTATLEAIGGRNFIAISRVDAWPTAPHGNSLKTLKKSGFKDFPWQIPGCHVHRFDDNARYGPEAFGPGPEGNLPVAAALPKDLQSFRDFLRCVAYEFNIEGLEEFPSPPGWQGLV